jgi:hypothetical protein
MQMPYKHSSTALKNCTLQVASHNLPLPNTEELRTRSVIHVVLVLMLPAWRTEPDKVCDILAQTQSSVQALFPYRSVTLTCAFSIVMFLK